MRGSRNHLNFANGSSSCDHPLDDEIRELFHEEKTINDEALRRAKLLVRYWRTKGGGGFTMLLSHLLDFVCYNPAPLSRSRALEK
ncbi:hypothetical protein DIPPA_35894 [Diplonema papillatum]|nr:hypothetical protein DIPPA_35894 [Diplonema papillatum]